MENKYNSKITERDAIGMSTEAINIRNIYGTNVHYKKPVTQDNKIQNSNEDTQTIKIRKLWKRTDFL